MELLNYNEDEKRQQKAELIQQRALILRATSTECIRQEVAFLQANLTIMKCKTSGELQQTVERTLEEIAGFWMHDKTRQDVARWVQTLICELNQQ